MQALLTLVQLSEIQFVATVLRPGVVERLFGLDPDEGNHGEDVKEAYFYLDTTPTHSFMRMRYLYPHAYPYSEMVEENGRRTTPSPCGRR